MRDRSRIVRTVFVDILKNLKTGRLFPATKHLLKNKNMVPASPEETEEYHRGMSRKDIELAEKHHDAAVVRLPDDFDFNVDISSFNKIQLLLIGDRLGVPGLKQLKVGQIKATLKEVIEKLKAQSENEREDSFGSDGTVDASDDIDHQE